MFEKAFNKRVLITGGRDFKDRNHIWAWLDYFNNKLKIYVIIEGEALGVDREAREWAVYNKIDVDPYPANWTMYGRSAGMIRNKEMLEKGNPDLVVAFKGGRGTANMVALANKTKIETIIIKYPSMPPL